MWGCSVIAQPKVANAKIRCAAARSRREACVCLIRSSPLTRRMVWMALPWRLPNSFLLGVLLVVSAMLATTVPEASTSKPASLLVCCSCRDNLQRHYSAAAAIATRNRSIQEETNSLQMPRRRLAIVLDGACLQTTQYTGAQRAAAAERNYLLCMAMPATVATVAFESGTLAPRQVPV